MNTKKRSFLKLFTANELIPIDSYLKYYKQEIGPSCNMKSTAQILQNPGLNEVVTIQTTE